MSDLKDFAKREPAIARLILMVVRALFFGHSGEQRAAIMAEVDQLDTDGDGVADDVDADPANAAVTARVPSRRKAKK